MNKIIFVAMSLVLLAGCPKEEAHVDYKPSEFKNVPFGTLEKSECSPVAADDQARTLMIRMPSEVTLKADEKLVLPICVYYNLDTLSVLEKSPQIYYKNLKEGGEFELVTITPEVEDHEVPAPKSSSKADNEIYKNQVSTAYLYFDAQKYISAPLTSGEYEFYVGIGVNKSDVVRVRINRE